MKIAIVTFHWAHNYGAVLQTYALQHAIENLGHEVEIINYRPEWAKESCKIKPQFSLRGAVKCIDSYLIARNFNCFAKQFLNVSSKEYKSSDIIEGYDYAIIGSDQVFNPDIINKGEGASVDLFYLLANVDKSTKKISYAASFGNSTLDDQFVEIFKKELKTFKAIGIREESGCNIVRCMGFNVCPVPDPTILYGDFSKVFTPKANSSEDYVFAFLFQKSQNRKQVCDVITQNTGLPLYEKLQLTERLKGKNGFYNMTPSEWIRAIYNSKFLITDSFHSTVFAILYHKPFISIALDGWGKDWYERIKVLLERLGLEQRLLFNPTQEKTREIYNSTIDWEDVDKRLSEWRCEGYAFLNHNLK